MAKHILAFEIFKNLKNNSLESDDLFGDSLLGLNKAIDGFYHTKRKRYIFHGEYDII